MKANVSWVRAMLVGLVLSCLSALAAQAEVTCGEEGPALRNLATKYNETAVWEGLAQDGVRLVITANPDGSTWTALALNGKGQACILGSGTRWQPGTPVALGEEG